MLRYKGTKLRLGIRTRRGSHVFLAILATLPLHIRTGKAFQRTKAQAGILDHQKGSWRKMLTPQLKLAHGCAALCHGNLFWRGALQFRHCEWQSMNTKNGCRGIADRLVGGITQTRWRLQMCARSSIGAVVRITRKNSRDTMAGKTARSKWGQRRHCKSS